MTMGTQQLLMLTKMFNRFLDAGLIKDYLVGSSTLLLHNKCDPAMLKTLLELLFRLSAPNHLQIFNKNNIRGSRDIQRRAKRRQSRIRARFSAIDHILASVNL